MAHSICHSYWWGTGRLRTMWGLIYTFSLSSLISFFLVSMDNIDTVVPRSCATPNYSTFAATLFWIRFKKIWAKLFFSKKNAIIFFPFILLPIWSIIQMTIFVSFFWGELRFCNDFRIGFKKLRYLFGEHKDSLGWGTSVIQPLVFFMLNYRFWNKAIKIDPIIYFEFP